MDPDPSLFSREAYQEIFTQISEAGWQSPGESSPAQLTDRVLTGDTEEQFQFHIAQCRPHLQLTMPDYVGANVCQIGVVNGLDKGLKNCSPDSELLHRIAQAHQSIGEKYQQGYVKTVGNHTTVYTGGVPPDYSQEPLTDTIRACTRASIETHHLHEMIHTIVSAYNSG